MKLINLGEKDLLLAYKYYNEINDSNSQALKHLIFLINKYTKEYEELNKKYQPLRSELESYNKDWWFSFKSVFSPSLSTRYNQVFKEVSKLVPQINKLVEKIIEVGSFKSQFWPKLLWKIAKVVNFAFLLYFYLGLIFIL
nr:hypothetical protein [Mycoplasmopsis bovis]